jgi:hypothetical protein
MHPRVEIEPWSERSIIWLYNFMREYEPDFDTQESKDPFTLAQTYQETLKATEDQQFRQIMGDDGKDKLNGLLENSFRYRHLAITACELTLLTGDELIDKYNTDEDKPALFTGILDYFDFENSGKTGRLYAAIVLPQFLRPSTDKLPELSSANKLAIPVDAVRGRVIDPEYMVDPAM